MSQAVAEMEKRDELWWVPKGRQLMKGNHAVVGAWPYPKSMRRALRYDGLLPAIKAASGEFRANTLDDIRQMQTYVAANRTATTPFEIIVEGQTPGEDQTAAAAHVREWAEAGATWWLEANWETTRDADGLQAVRRRIQQGPPCLESSRRQP